MCAVPPTIPALDAYTSQMNAAAQAQAAASAAAMQAAAVQGIARRQAAAAGRRSPPVRSPPPPAPPVRFSDFPAWVEAAKRDGEAAADEKENTDAP